MTILLKRPIPYTCLHIYHELWSECFMVGGLASGGREHYQSAAQQENACVPFFTFSAQPPAGVYLASKTTGIRRQWGLSGKCLEVSFLKHTVYSDAIASRSRNKQPNKKI